MPIIHKHAIVSLLIELKGNANAEALGRVARLVSEMEVRTDDRGTSSVKVTLDGDLDVMNETVDKIREALGSD